MNIRKGDTVFILAGKEKGRTGKVDRVLADQNRLIVEGLNMVTRHVKPRPDLRQAGRIQKESPINFSNAMLVCNKCGKPTRPIASSLDDGRKVRVCRQCRETID